MRNISRSSASVTSHQDSGARERQARPNAAYLVVFGAVLALGAALRLWQLASKPDWQYDEGVYTTVATNVLRYGTLNEHVMLHTPWSPFLYQPPLYFVGLARWFALVGPSIYHARLLGVVCSLVTFALLFRLLWRLRGPQAALFTIIPVILDGWLLYIQHVSYMENVLLTLVVAGMLAYQRALENGSYQRFALAGAVFGVAACFKYTGAYVITTALLCWLILRRHHRQHLVLLATFAAVIAVYVLVMVRLFDVPGHDWFIQQNTVQIRRVLGLQSSGGTLTSPTAALHLLFAQYRVFLPSFLIALAAFILAVRLTWRCYRARSWAPARADVLLYSWLASGVVVFGFSSLRFPQYFALILVPMYCFWWTSLWARTRPVEPQALTPEPRALTPESPGALEAPGTGERGPISPALAVAVAGVAVLAGLGSFWLRVPAHTGNPFRAAQAYAAASIPRRSVVMTEESIGDLISQPWCRVEDATPCATAASYAITWKTYLQSSFKLGDPAFLARMKGAVPLISFSGFSGTATVWKLK